MTKIIQNHHDFEKYTNKKRIDKKAIKGFFESNFLIKSPEKYLNKINWKNNLDPIKLMTIPHVFENNIKEYEITDPIGDQPHLATKNMVHRYPDRVLILLTNHCHINCRFCFRKELSHHSTPPKLEEIKKYLSKHTEVNEVIFSGGDPLSLSAKYLDNIFEKLKEIKHIKRFRFHTRIPIVNPQHISKPYLELFKKIAKQKQLSIVLHVNHPREIDKSNIALFSKLRKEALLLSQTVLLKNVNNDPKVLKELFTELLNHNVKPYYLHHPDLVKGTSHFRVSIEDGKEIYQKLRGNTASQAIPEYVLDLPGGKGKVPVLSLKKIGRNKYQIKNFENKNVIYIDPK